MNFNYRKTEVVDSKVKTITPEMADRMLESNHGNRKLSMTLVRQYASYIKKGLWQENGQAIQISTDGILLDGQHRLSAIILANIPANMVVTKVRATDDEGELNARGMALDLNSKRKHSDISGIPFEADKIAGNLIQSLVVGGKKQTKNTVLRANVYYDLQDSIDAILSRASKKVKYYSRAVIKGAIALRHHQGYDFIDIYNDALNMNMRELPDIWLSWWRQVGQIEGNSQEDREKLLAITWEATSPKENDRSRIILQKKTIEKNITEITGFFYGACADSIIGTT